MLPVSGTTIRALYIGEMGQRRSGDGCHAQEVDLSGRGRRGERGALSNAGGLRQADPHQGRQVAKQGAGRAYAGSQHRLDHVPTMAEWRVARGEGTMMSVLFKSTLPGARRREGWTRHIPVRRLLAVLAILLLGVVGMVVRVGLFPPATSIQGGPLAVDAHTNRVFAVSLVPHSTRGATFGSWVTTAQCKLRTLDATTGALVHTAAALPGTGPCSLVVATGANHVFLAASQPFISIYDATTGMLLRTVHTPTSPTLAAVDERAGRTFTVNFGDVDTVSTLNSRTGTVLRTVPVGQYAGGLGVDERTGRVFVADLQMQAFGAPATVNGLVHILDAATGTVVRTVTVGKSPSLAQVDAQTNRIFVLNSGEQ